MAPLGQLCKLARLPPIAVYAVYALSSPAFTIPGTGRRLGRRVRGRRLRGTASARTVVAMDGECEDGGCDGRVRGRWLRWTATGTASARTVAARDGECEDGGCYGRRDQDGECKDGGCEGRRLIRTASAKTVAASIGVDRSAIKANASGLIDRLDRSGRLPQQGVCDRGGACEYSLIWKRNECGRTHRTYTKELGGTRLRAAATKCCTPKTCATTPPGTTRQTAASSLLAATTKQGIWELSSVPWGKFPIGLF